MLQFIIFNEKVVNLAIFRIIGSIRTVPPGFGYGIQVFACSQFVLAAYSFVRGP